MRKLKRIGEVESTGKIRIGNGNRRWIWTHRSM